MLDTYLPATTTNQFTRSYNFSYSIIDQPIEHKAYPLYHPYRAMWASLRTTCL